MTATVVLAGDTMLGRGVADLLIRDRATPLVAPEVVDQLASADAVVLNLECCISDHGTRFPDPRKPFFFRAPPVAAERLAQLGVDAVTLANNHALDYGPQALLDTLCHLERAGIAAVGAGADDSSAREPLLLGCGPLRVRVVAFSDHPAAYAAGPGRARCGGPSRPSGRTRPGWSRRSTGRHRSRDSSPRSGARAPRCARPVGRGACGRRGAGGGGGEGGPGGFGGRGRVGEGGPEAAGRDGKEPLGGRASRGRRGAGGRDALCLVHDPPGVPGP